MMDNNKDSQICFIISPIGEPDSEARNRSDTVLNYIIKPVIEEYDYQVQRADKISEAGMITSQIIQHIIDDELVVADLTGHNPNVFYELAIRHAFRKPVIQIIEKGHNIPFDVSQIRTIIVDHHDLASADQCRTEIRKQIAAIRNNAYGVESPVSTAVDLLSLRSSDNPLERIGADILSAINEINARITGLQQATNSIGHILSPDGRHKKEWPSGAVISAVLNAQKNIDLYNEQLEVLDTFYKPYPNHDLANETDEIRPD